MKRSVRIVSALLCICLLASFTGCKKTGKNPPEQQPPTNKKEPVFDADTNTWVLYEAEHLNLLAQYPDANFVIAEELDCTDMVWTPIPEFTGTVSGVWGGVFNHTISNLVIEGKPDTNAVGLFGTVSGKVTDLNFKNVTVKLPNGFSGNAGLIAGTMKTDLVDIEVSGLNFQVTGGGVYLGGLVGKLEGKAEECWIQDGTISGTLTGGTNIVGGFAGQTNKDVSNVVVSADITLTVSGTGYIGGVIGELAGGAASVAEYTAKMKIDAGNNEYAISPVVGSLNGRLANGFNSARECRLTGTKITSGNYYGVRTSKGKTTDCFCRGLQHVIAYENASQAEKDLRDLVVQYMYEECTLPWTPSWDMHYEDTCGGTKNHVQNYYAGVTYFGLPYMHLCGSLERMEYWLNEDSTIKENLPNKNICNSGWSTPYGSWDYYIGNDCSDAVYWAWQQVSAKVKYCQTLDILKQILKEDTLYRVGSYTLPKTASDTTAIINANQALDIYKAYAEMRPGDAVFNYVSGAGHMRLVAELPHVFYTEKGNLDIYRSYVLLHEQGYNVAGGATRNSTCGVYIKYTFLDLFNRSYVPLTIAALRDGEATPIQTTNTVTGTTMADLWKGYISCNYRLNAITLTIFDSTGKVITTATVHPTEAYAHALSYELVDLKSMLDLKPLKAGQTYHCTVTIHVSNKDVKLIDGNFTA